MSMGKTKGYQEKNLWYIGLFAVAMAYLESAVVVYLKRIYNISDLITSPPFLDSQVGDIEIGREIATPVISEAVGGAAGKSFQPQLGFSAFAFGLWDIFYYIWLKLFLGWPASLSNIEVLFLIPLLWWRPVLAPILISGLMVVAGAMAVIRNGQKINIQVNPNLLISLGSGGFYTIYFYGRCTQSDANQCAYAQPAKTNTFQLAWLSHWHLPNNLALWHLTLRKEQG